MSEPTTPSLLDLFRRAGAQLLDGMHVTLPARVERYDADRQCVDAQPWIQREVTLEDGSTAIERLPVVTNAPVMFPRSGDYAITFPIAVGSTVILHFTSASLDRWLAIGGEVAPGDARKLTLNDAFAVPSGHSFAGETAPSTSAPTNAMVMHAAALKLGGPGAVEDVAFHSAIAALADVFDNWTPVAGDGGGALKTLLTALINSGWPVGSTTVKAL